MIDVEYAALGAVIDAERACKRARRSSRGGANNIAANFQVNVGDVDAAFRDSDLIVEEEFSTQRHSAVPLENRGLVAEWDEGRGF